MKSIRIPFLSEIQNFEPLLIEMDFHGNKVYQGAFWPNFFKIQSSTIFQ
jgi:hypothetical protein